MSVNISEIFSSIQGEGRFAGHPAIFIRFAGCSVKCDFCDTKHAQNLNEETRVQMDNLHSYNIHKNQGWEESGEAWTTATIQEVYEYVADLIEQSSNDKKKRIQMIVITGGEPFEQAQALGELCVKLPFLAHPENGVTDYVHICIESSGTVPVSQPINKYEELPTTTAGSVLDYIRQADHCFLTISPKHKPVQMEYVYSASQLKFLVGKDEKDDIPIPLEVFKHVTERCEGITFQPIWYANSHLTTLATQRAVKKACINGGTVSVQIHKLLGIR